MSSILKALKKVEADNASRRPDELRIDSEILRTENHSRFSSTAILLASLLFMAFGAGGTYLYMKRGKAPEHTGSTAGVVTVQKPLPTSAPPETPAEQLPPAIVVVPAKQQLSPERAKGEQTPASRQMKSIPDVARQPAAVTRPASDQQRGTLLPAPANSSAVPQIRVNGIAIQDDSSESVAMINGEPVLRGGIINGVTVEEIYKNRVKFNYNGTIFDVSLGQSNK